MIRYSTRQLLAAGCIVAVSPLASAQTTATVAPTAGESVTVTENSSTWIQVLQQNGIDIPAGANGVVISNGVGGVITAPLNAIISAADATAVVNAGQIAGGLNGINFVNSTNGTITNLTGGLISSDSRAVDLGTGTLLNNAGTILGTASQRNGTVYADAGVTGYTVNNSGTIDAGQGNQGSGLALEIADLTTATITNSGTIQGRIDGSVVSAASGASADGVRLANFNGAADRVFEGTITNEATGVISSESANGTVAGLRVANTVGFQGTLDNAGLIEGVQNGLYFGNAVNGLGGDHTGGVVNNTGRIESDSRALNIDGTGLEVNNSGTILATGTQRNGTVYADSTAQGFVLNNQASGVIDAGEGLEGAAFSVELSEAGNDFDINNDGQIIGRGAASAGATTAGDGIRLERTRVGGALEGSTTGLFTGNITNKGTISSESNDGTTGGFRAVNGVSFQGELINSGTISGVQNGVYFGNAVGAGGADHTGGVVNNLESGVISSDSRALNIDGTGLVVNNAGTILATSTQRNGTVYADSTAQGFVLNNQASGVIDAGEGLEGAAFSVELSEAGNDFDINNDGQIIGRGAASAGATTAGDGIRLERTRVGGALEGSTTGLFTGNITNKGTISSESNDGTTGGFRAVNGVSFQGELINSGTISGVQNGVYFGNAVGAGGADHTGGVVLNTTEGVISSDSRAVNIDGTGLSVINEGQILATGRQRNGTVYADATADNYSLLNTGFIGSDGINGAGSAVSLQTGSFAGDVVTASVTNAGLIAGSGDQALDAAVRIFSGSADGVTTFSGDIVNLATGTLTADAAPAVLVQEGVDFDGSLINSGLIDGGASLATGDAVLSDTSVISLTITSLTDFETFDLLSGDLAAGGELAIDFEGDFVPQVGQTFDLLDFDTLSGSFASIDSGPIVFDTSDLLVGGSVTITAVPEPGVLALLGLGSIALVGRRRQA